MAFSCSIQFVSVLHSGFYFVFHHICIRHSPPNEQRLHQLSVSSSSIYVPNVATNNCFPVLLQACYHWFLFQHLESITTLLHQIFRFTLCLFPIQRHYKWNLLTICIYGLILHWPFLHDPLQQWFYTSFFLISQDKWNSTYQSQFLLLNYIFTCRVSRHHRFFLLLRWFPPHQRGPLACCRYTVICERTTTLPTGLFYDRNYSSVYKKRHYFRNCREQKHHVQSCS